MTTTEQWAQWEKQVVNGIFPLHRAVSHSNHSAVFLTEHRALSVPSALLKLVPAIPTFRDTQLAHWETAATLTHPNLSRVLETGHCQLGGLQFLFVVMEYAEETLARFLRDGPLAPSALESALQPILTSLGFLHRNRLVHGGLKPSNVLLVGQRVKLASDTVRPAGESAASIAGSSVYDPPEARDGSYTPAGDIWSLGMVMVEALTRCLPIWCDKDADVPELPPALPEKFVDIVQRCLHRDPAKRPTVDELETLFNTTRPIRVPQPPAAESPPKIGAQLLALLAEDAVHYPVLMPAPPERPQPQQDASPAVLGTGKYRARASVGALLAFGFVVGLVGVWACLHLPVSQATPTGADTALVRVTTAVPASDAPLAPGPPPRSAAAVSTFSATSSTQLAQSPAVVREVSPDVPASALTTIQGHIKFAVRVQIGGSGDVVRTSLASRSPSHYFTRLAMDTAREWKFVADDGAAPRHCLVWFDFTHNGAVAYSDLTKMRYVQRD